MRKKLLLTLAVSLLLTCYTKEGDVIYETDPDDTAPIFIVAATSYDEIRVLMCLLARMDITKTK